MWNVLLCGIYRDMEKKYIKNNMKCLRVMCIIYSYVKTRLITIRASHSDL